MLDQLAADMEKLDGLRAVQGVILPLQNLIKALPRNLAGNRLTVPVVFVFILELGHGGKGIVHFRIALPDALDQLRLLAALCVLPGGGLGLLLRLQFRL